VVVERVAGDPPASQRVIVSLARVGEGRVTSWQDFFDPAAWAEVERPRGRVGESKRATAR
jgi:hypothetical protein